ncbi:MAG: hypothetical protein ACLQNU_02630 [Candidatus Dormibacteria bacterium]
MPATSIEVGPVCQQLSGRINWLLIGRSKQDVWLGAAECAGCSARTLVPALDAPRPPESELR